MKNPLLLLAWTVLMLVAAGPPTGCKASSSAGTGNQGAPTLPTGAYNTFDATAYRTIADAHTAVATAQKHDADGTLKLNVQQKSILNRVIDDQNAAQQLYIAYHATQGAGDPTKLTQAIQQLVADIAMITTDVTGGK